jgi:hypothetical protein
MRSYNKVWTNNLQDRVSGSETNECTRAMALNRGKKQTNMDRYNFLANYDGRVADPTAPLYPNAITWRLEDDHGLTIVTFSGQQLANAIFPLQNYSLHREN